jgi:3-oxoadipate CoA-transferase beta subunit
MIEHLNKQVQSKIVAQCSYPLTAPACVARIYTDLAVIDVTPQGLRVRDQVIGLDHQTLQSLSGVPLLPA